MSRNATAMNPGRANKRFMVLAIVLGLLGALLVYVAFNRGGSSDSSPSSSNVPVVVAKSDIPARTKITQSMLEVRLVSPNSVSADAILEPSQVVGQVTRFPISANQQIVATS